MRNVIFAFYAVGIIKIIMFQQEVLGGIVLGLGITFTIIEYFAHREVKSINNDKN